MRGYWGGHGGPAIGRADAGAGADRQPPIGGCMTARILFATWEGGGHVAPALMVASQLARLGAQVLIVSDEANRAAAQAQGLDFTSWNLAPNRKRAGDAADSVQDWRAQTPDTIIHQLCEEVICGPAAAYCADVRAIARAFRPDLIVTNELLFGVMMAAEAESLPFAILTGNLWPFPTRTDLPPFGPGLKPAREEMDYTRDAMIRRAVSMLYDAHLPALNGARAANGLAALDGVLRQLEGARLIALSVAQAFDFGADPAPAPFFYAGPMVRDPDWVDGLALPIGGDCPLVLISTSTLYQAQEDMLRRCIEAVRDEPIEALVTLGPALRPESFGDGPRNVRVLANASHDALVPHCAAVISHAGHGTLVRPLLHGVPVINLPMGRDQLDNAVRASSRGAGLTLSAEAPAHTIREALRLVLGDARYRNAAAQLGEKMRAETDGGVRAARRLLALILATPAG